MTNCQSVSLNVVVAKTGILKAKIQLETLMAALFFPEEIAKDDP
jgi:hypothetical protein